MPRHNSKPGCFSAVNVGSEYTPEEFAFMKAMERYQRENHRPFPTYTEILAVLLSLGYRQTAQRPGQCDSGSCDTVPGCSRK